MLTTSGKINVYEMETGKFLYDIKIPDKETAQFAMLNDTLVATFMLNSSGQQKERIYISSQKENILNTFYRCLLYTSSLSEAKRFPAGIKPPKRSTKIKDSIFMILYLYRFFVNYAA